MVIAVRYWQSWSNQEAPNISSDSCLKFHCSDRVPLLPKAFSIHLLWNQKLNFWDRDSDQLEDHLNTWNWCPEKIWCFLKINCPCSTPYAEAEEFKGTLCPWRQPVRRTVISPIALPVTLDTLWTNTPLNKSDICISNHG